jgi:hypothetical protein
VTFAGNFVGHRRQVADGVADIVQTLGGGDFADLCAGHVQFESQKALNSKSREGRKEKPSIPAPLPTTDH